MREPSGENRRESRVSILVVDDNEQMREVLIKLLAKRGFMVADAASAVEALKRIDDYDYDLMLADVRMPNIDGLQLLKRVKEKRPDMIVILMTAFGSIEAAVEAIKEGAEDYVSKPFQIDEIVLKIQRSLERHQLRRKVERLQMEVGRQYSFSNIVGKSKPMRQIFSIVSQVASSDCTVLITGSTGTGKELVARAIHYNSRRRDKPFVDIDCGAIPESLLESELFGYEKGAFTGASQMRRGLLEEASGGTVFLDEISTIPMSVQAKLLRVLQERTLRRIGGRENIRVDVRLIAATNEDLRKEVQMGRFRQDLYYRLNVVPIRLPDLKDRREDIPLLVEHFILKRTREQGGSPKRFSKEAMQILLDYSWPGNVRELENAVTYALTLSKGEVLTIEDLPPEITASGTACAYEGYREISLEELERLHILKTLEHVGGNRCQAAQILGINRRTLYRKLRRYGANN